MKDAPRPRRIVPLLLGLAAVAVLAACGGQERPDVEAQLSQPLVVETVPTGCPEVLVVGDAGTVAHVAAGAAAERQNIQAAGRIVDFRGSCDYYDNGVQIYLFMLIVAERGPAYGGGELPFDFFVGILDPQGQRVSRQDFPLPLAFTEGPQNGSSEEIELYIPLANPGLGSSYRVVMGFDLTPQQLEFNRTQL